LKDFYGLHFVRHPHGVIHHWEAYAFNLLKMASFPDFALVIPINSSAIHMHC